MGCALSSVKSVSNSSIHHVEESTGANNGQSVAIPFTSPTETRLEDGQITKRTFDLFDQRPQCTDALNSVPCRGLCLGNSGDLKAEAVTCNTMASTVSPMLHVCVSDSPASKAIPFSSPTETRLDDGQITKRTFDLFDQRPQCTDALNSVPCRGLCLGNSGDLKAEAVTCNTMASAVSPMLHVCVSDSPASKGVSVRTNLSEIFPEPIDVNRSTKFSLLEWLHAHHQYHELQINDIPSYCDPTYSGDGISEHWSTRLSPTMRSETSLHPSIAIQDNDLRHSVTSDFVHDGQETHEVEAFFDPFNPAISVIACENSVESIDSPVISPSQFGAIMAVTSIVNRPPSSAAYSPSGLSVMHSHDELFGNARHAFEGLHFLLPTVVNNMILDNVPYEDAE